MVKEAKARRKAKIKGKRKWNKTIGILLFTAVMGTLITLSALTQRNSLPPPVIKKPAKDYFSFSDVLAIGEPADPENITLIVRQVGFYITPVGGNATNVLIYPLQGAVLREDSLHLDEMINGTSVSVGPIEYPYEVVTEKEEGKGWPLLFQITCNEAGGEGSEGEVTVYVTRFLHLGS